MKLVDLKEGKDAPLYHGTSLHSVAMILASNSLDEGVHWGRPGEPNGPRLTRDFRIAWSFAGNSEWGQGGVLQLSQTRLAQRYRIQPYQDVDMAGEPWSDEYEEVVITNSIQPLDRYLEILWLSDHVIKSALDDPEYIKSLALDWVDIEPNKLHSMITLLYKHPKRKNPNPNLEEYT